MKLRRNVLISTLVAFISLLLFNIDTLQAEEFHVTTAGEFQNALTSARDNGQADTIWLAAGTYNTSDNAYAFTYITAGESSNDLTIKGEEGTSVEDVILDGNNKYEVLSIEQGFATVTIEGITAKNGMKGISVINAFGDIILSNNVIIDNNNKDISSKGGGVYLNSIFSNTILISNVITNNSAHNGGGIYTQSGGLFNIILLNNNIITGNMAKDISSTSGDGGGVYVSSSLNLFASCVVTLTNNTLAKNEATQKGGGIFLSLNEGNVFHFYNNIVWKNSAKEGKDIYNSGHIYSSTYVHNNNFHDIAGLAFSENVDNIDDDPLFVNPEHGDYRLLPDSPCIDKGTADAPELPSTDFEGESRIIGNAPDIGADEFDSSSPPTTTTTAICTSETIYGDDSDGVEILRYFRDNVLSQTPEGQELIKLYYQWSPAIVKAMEGDEEFKEEMKEMIDGILPMIKGEVE